MSEYAGEPEQDIKDPYGKGIEEYNACFEMICRLVGKVESIWMGCQKKKKIKEKNNDSNWL